MSHRVPSLLPFLVAVCAALAGCERMDAARAPAWSLSLEGVSVQQPGRIARTGVTLPGWEVAGEGYACMPALALGPGGDAFVTSNVSPVIWRIDARTLKVTAHRLELDADHDKEVGFTGLAYSPAEDVFHAASAAHGSFWRIDPLLKTARKVAVSASARGECALVVPQVAGLAR